MPKLFPTIRRVIQQVAGGSANWRAQVDPGIQLGTRLESVFGLADVGLDVAQAPSTLLAGQNPALALSNLTASTVKAAQSPALLVTNRALSTVKPQQAPAFDITRLTDDLTHLRGGSSVVETAVGGRTDWANDANAISGTAGRTDGVLATIAGNVAGARGGRLDLTYPAQPTTRSGFTITEADLLFYVRQQGTVLNNGTLILAWGAAGEAANARVLETITGDVNSLGTPRTFDILPTIGQDWTKLSGMKASVHFEAAAAELQTADVDAVELRVVADLIVNL